MSALCERKEADEAAPADAAEAGASNVGPSMSSSGAHLHLHLHLHGPGTGRRSREAKRSKDAKKRRYRSQLELEVQKLQEQLQQEIDLHLALANALRRSAPESQSPSNLPLQAQELVENVIGLEAVVSKLEQELSALHLSLSQAKSDRELSFKSSAGEVSSSASPSRESVSDCSWEEHISSLRASKKAEATVHHRLRPIRLAADDSPSPSGREEDEGWQSCSTEIEERYDPGQVDQRRSAAEPLSVSENLLVHGKNLWRDPNRLSEEMVRCMRSIFLSLAESKRPGRSPGRSPSPRCSSFGDNAAPFDPYGVHAKAGGSAGGGGGAYRSATEVSWLIVGKKQLQYAAETLRVFRYLVAQLVRVSPAKLRGDERLAFWINLYNALVMHAYLAYGVPRNAAKHSALMHKVSYTIGGLTISAAEIEVVILKMKPPAHRPHIASVFSSNKEKASEEHWKLGVDEPEPLAVFGLSCGMYSSPAVRVFTAGGVREELEGALREYVRASVGIGPKGGVVVPRLVHGFARAVGIEDSLLVDWICRFLPPALAAEVRHSASPLKQRLLGARGFVILPFDSRFRYLFLPDHDKSN